MKDDELNYVTALYYAFGRRDMGDRKHDAVAFAHAYVAARNTPAFQPAVQSLWIDHEPIRDAA